MCKHPAIRAPFRTFCGPYFLRRAIKPGISFSAISISFRPHSASEISAERIKNKAKLMNQIKKINGKAKRDLNCKDYNVEMMDVNKRFVNLEGQIETVKTKGRAHERQ